MINIDPPKLKEYPYDKWVILQLYVVYAYL